MKKQDTNQASSPDIEYSDDKRSITIDMDWKEYVGIALLIAAISCTGIYGLVL